MTKNKERQPGKAKTSRNVDKKGSAVRESGREPRSRGKRADADGDGGKKTKPGVDTEDSVEAEEK